MLTPNHAPESEQIQRGSRTLYLKRYGTPVILRKGEGNNKFIINQLLTHEERNGTLKGLIYEWERTGATRNDTTYILSALPDHVDDPTLEEPLQSLEELIISEARLSNYPAREKQEPQSATGPSAPGSSVSSLMGLLRGGGSAEAKPEL